MLSTDEDKICTSCGKTKSSGSLTQWIFSSDTCHCLISEKPRTLKLCPFCGCRQNINKGSITQWIFQHQSCTCSAPTEGVATTGFPHDKEIAGSPYEFIGIAGKGGVGTVYKANAKKLGKSVAIKAINASSDQAFDTQRFEREARLASKLHHPNILSVLDFGYMVDGRPYLVTEWVEGCTLAQYIEQNGRLSIDSAREVFCAVLDGLSHAHKRQILHRDIKPGNIMLSRTKSGWVVKIIDFGTAKDIGNDQSSTRVENLACSPYYVSPEQLNGLRLDQRTDLYSLGCTMFESLTGRPPFTGRPIMVTIKHQSEAPPTLWEATKASRFPDYLEKIVAKLLAKEPVARFNSADEVKAAIEERRSPAETYTSTQVTGNRRPSRMAIAIGASAAFFLVTVIVVIALNFTTWPTGNSYTPVDPMWVECAGDGNSTWRTVSKSVSDDELRQISKIPSYSFVLLKSENSGFSTTGLRDLLNGRQLKGLAITLTSSDQLATIVANGLNLQALVLGGVSRLRDEDFDQLARLTNLRVLILTTDELTDQSLITVRMPTEAEINDEFFKRHKAARTSVVEVDHDGSSGTHDEPSFGQADSNVSSLHFLRSLTQLKLLGLRGLQLTDLGWSNIASMTQLSALNISKTNVTNDSMKRLKGLQLNKLDVSDTNLTNNSFLQLHPMYSLRELRAERLHEQLIHQRIGRWAPNLTAFNTYGSETDKDRPWVSLRGPEIVEGKLIPRGFSTDKGKINKEAVRYLALDTADDKATSISDETLACLRQYPRLEAISMTQSNAITDAGMEHVGNMPQLRCLTMFSSKITDKGVAPLSRLKNLEELTIPTQALTDRALAVIGGISSLRVLNFGYGDKVSDLGLKHISRLQNLRSLELSHCKNVTDAGIAHLTNLKNLAVLRVSFTKITDEGFLKLAKLKTLKIIEIQACRVTNRAVQQLQAKLPLVHVHRKVVNIHDDMDEALVSEIYKFN